MAKSVQIASIFTAIGFKVDKKDLDNLQKQLANMKKQLTQLKNAAKFTLDLKAKGLDQTKKQLASINAELSKVKSKTITVKVQQAGSGGSVSGGVARGAFAGSAAGSQLSQFGAGVGSVGALAFGGASIFQTTAQLDAIKNALNAAAGSAEEGAKQFEFLRQTTDTIGINLLDNARSYQNFLAASNSVGFSVGESQEVFTATASAARVLGLSAADTNGAMRAMTQILSKGTVQAEELRGQLGERVPGAVGLMAKAVGQMNGGVEVSVAQLGKMLEQGQIISKDVMPFFAKELQKFAESNGALAKAQKSPLANLERMKNAFVEFQDTVGRSTFVHELSVLFKEISSSLKSGEGEASALGQTLSIIVNMAQAFIGVLTAIPGPIKVIGLLLALIFAPFLGTLLAIGGFLLVIDDFIRFLQGKSGFLTELFGRDALFKGIDNLKQGLIDSARAFGDWLVAGLERLPGVIASALDLSDTAFGRFVGGGVDTISNFFSRESDPALAAPGQIGSGITSGTIDRSGALDVRVNIEGKIEGATFDAKAEKE